MGPNGKCIFFYNFKDIAKIMILVRLQRLEAERKYEFF